MLGVLLQLLDDAQLGELVGLELRKSTWGRVSETMDVSQRDCNGEETVREWLRCAQIGGRPQEKGFNV